MTAWWIKAIVGEEKIMEKNEKKYVIKKHHDKCKIKRIKVDAIMEGYFRELLEETNN